MPILLPQMLEHVVISALMRMIRVIAGDQFCHAERRNRAYDLVDVNELLLRGMRIGHYCLLLTSPTPAKVTDFVLEIRQYRALSDGDTRWHPLEYGVAKSIDELTVLNTDDRYPPWFLGLEAIGRVLNDQLVTRTFSDISMYTKHLALVKQAELSTLERVPAVDRRAVQSLKAVAEVETLRTIGAATDEVIKALEEVKMHALAGSNELRENFVKMFREQTETVDATVS